MKPFSRHHKINWDIQNLLLSGILTFLIESMARHSFAAAGLFLLKTPLAFLCNWLIVCVSLSIAILAAPRQDFFRGLIMLIWLVCGIVNCVVLRYRMTPFSAEDLKMVPSLLRIADNYLTKGGAVIVIAGVGLFIASVVFLCCGGINGKEKMTEWKNVSTTCSTLVLGEA